MKCFRGTGPIVANTNDQATAATGDVPFSGTGTSISSSVTSGNPIKQFTLTNFYSRVVLTRNLPILVLIYKLANWSELERRRNLPKRIQRRFSQKSLIASCTLSIKNAGLLWINFYPKAWRKHYAVSSYYEKTTFSWFDKISVAWVDHSQCRFESCPELDKFMIQKWGFRRE